MKSLADIGLAMLVIVAYWLPTINAKLRHVRGIGQVVIVNLFFGWTAIGWIIALVMSFRADVKTAMPRHARPEEPSEHAEPRTRAEIEHDWT